MDRRLDRQTDNTDAGAARWRDSFKRDLSNSHTQHTQRHIDKHTDQHTDKHADTHINSRNAGTCNTRICTHAYTHTCTHTTHKQRTWMSLTERICWAWAPKTDCSSASHGISSRMMSGSEQSSVPHRSSASGSHSDMFAPKIRILRPRTKQN